MSHNGKFSEILEAAFKYSYLNLLWIVFSIPLVTIVPATVAVQGVIKEWSAGNELPITTTFWSNFKGNLTRGISVSLLQFFVILVLVGDFFVMMNLTSDWKILAVAIICLFLFFYLMMAVYLHPLMIDFEMTFLQLLRNAFFLAASQPFVAILNLVIIGCMLVISCLFPFLFFICSFSVSIMINYRLSKLIFRKVEKVTV
ncbi:YesL family protein [Heyndrickxia sporothermodurans]